MSIEVTERRDNCPAGERKKGTGILTQKVQRKRKGEICSPAERTLWEES